MENTLLHPIWPFQIQINALPSGKYPCNLLEHDQRHPGGIFGLGSTCLPTRHPNLYKDNGRTRQTSSESTEKTRSKQPSSSSPQVGVSHNRGRVSWIHG